MNNEPLWRKQVANVIYVLIFTGAIFITKGWFQVLLIISAIGSVLYLIIDSNKKGNELVFNIAILIGSVQAFAVGILTITDHLNNDAIIIARIGLIAMSVTFFIVSIILFILFIYLLYTCFNYKSFIKKSKKNSNKIERQ